MWNEDWKILVIETKVKRWAYNWKKEKKKKKNVWLGGCKSNCNVFIIFVDFLTWVRCQLNCDCANELQFLKKFW